MVRFVRLSFGMLVRLIFRRQSLLLENLALRQQLVMLKRRHPRPSLGLLDKLFWVIARRVWSGWKQALLVVSPETVVRWHRAGFRMYWRLISRVPRQVGRKQTPKEIRELIFQMVAENPTWGTPRIHGELRILGFDLSERTISPWMQSSGIVRIDFRLVFHAHRARPLRVFLLYRVDNPIHAYSTRTASFRASA